MLNPTTGIGWSEQNLSLSEWISEGTHAKELYGLIERIIIQHEQLDCRFEDLDLSGLLQVLRKTDSRYDDDRILENFGEKVEENDLITLQELVLGHDLELDSWLLEKILSNNVLYPIPDPYDQFDFADSFMETLITFQSKWKGEPSESDLIEKILMFDWQKISGEASSEVAGYPDFKELGDSGNELAKKLYELGRRKIMTPRIEKKPNRLFKLKLRK